MRRYLPYLVPYRRRILLVLLVSLVAIGLQTTLPLLLARAINAVASEHRSNRRLIESVLAMFGLAILMIPASAYRNFLLFTVAESIARDNRSKDEDAPDEERGEHRRPDARERLPADEPTPNAMRRDPPRQSLADERRKAARAADDTVEDEKGDEQPFRRTVRPVRADKGKQTHCQSAHDGARDRQYDDPRAVGDCAAKNRSW